MRRKPKILILGARGQIGRALRRQVCDGIFLGREDADLLRPETLPEIVRSIAPDILINAAAYTQVDQAENDPDSAFAVNAQSPIALAQIASQINIPFIHYSTDYVFNGRGKRPWTEMDMPDPVNIYGASKLAGEEGIKNIGGKHLILRTSWVFDSQGVNFLSTMLRLGGEREELKVVSDQYGAPTKALHLAEATLAGLHNAMEMEIFPSGVYHICAAGETSWYGFAIKIFAEAHASGISLKLKRLEPITSQDYPLPAPRPRNSRLDCSKAKRILNISLPDWNVGVEETVKENVICNL